MVVEPVDPFQGGELDRLHAAPRAAPMDDLGLEQAVGRRGQGVVAKAAHAADRGLHACLGEALGIVRREALRSPVATMHEPVIADGAALMQGLLQGVQHNEPSQRHCSERGGERRERSAAPAGRQCAEQRRRSRSPLGDPSAKQPAAQPPKAATQTKPDPVAT